MNAPEPISKITRRQAMTGIAVIPAVAATALPASAMSPEDVDQRIGNLAEEISELLPHHPIQHLGSRCWHVEVSERGYWFSAARASKQPAASLVAAIQADREAVAAVKAARERLFALYAEYPEFDDLPHVLLKWGCIGAPEKAFSYIHIRAHVRRTGKYGFPRIEQAELDARQAELIRELRRNRRAYFAGQRRVGITAAQEAVSACWERIEVTRSAVLSHPCASMADIVAKGRHLIEVVDRGDHDAMIEAWGSILPTMEATA